VRLLRGEPRGSCSLSKDRSSIVAEKSVNCSSAISCISLGFINSFSYLLLTKMRRIYISTSNR
jgi:hypothetical protein